MRVKFWILEPQEEPQEEEEGGRASVCVVVVSVVLGNIQIETAVDHFLSTYQKR